MSPPRLPEADALALPDARAMRALAHPTRIAILDHLYLHGPATATQCAPAVGASPSVCSFHLRSLARRGFVESLPFQGRARPWRAAARQAGWPFNGAEFRPEGAAATVLLRDLLRRDEQLLERYLEQEASFSREWRQTAAIASSTVYLTPAELAALTLSCYELLRPYLYREAEPPRPGARRVHLVFRTIPSVDEQVQQCAS